MLNPTGRRTPSFVDVGCGPGTKLLIAMQFGFHAYGIELDERLARIGREITRDVKHANALEEDYGMFDAIYFFCPIRDDALEAKLERRIIATAKSGALIIGNMKCVDNEDLRRRVWDKKKVELAAVGVGNDYGNYAAFEVHRKR